MPEPFIGEEATSRVGAAHVYPSPPAGDSVQVGRIVDIKIKFWSLVWLFVPAIAAIPAGIILTVLYLLFVALLNGGLAVLRGVTVR